METRDEVETRETHLIYRTRDCGIVGIIGCVPTKPLRVVRKRIENVTVAKDNSYIQIGMAKFHGERIIENNRNNGEWRII